MAPRVKDFDKIYRERGAYHLAAEGFDRWCLDDNYTKIAAFCGSARRLLDLGCGEGRLSDYTEGVEVIDGIDYLQSALDLNRNAYGQRYRHLYRAHLKDLATLGIAAGDYDHVVSSLTLMYLTRDELADCLAAVRDMLCAGGLVVATYPTLTPLRAPSAESYELPARELSTAFVQAGFAIEAMEPICPFLPKEVVTRSHVAETAAAAREDYLAARARMDMTNSYHFLIAARKP